MRVCAPFECVVEWLCGWYIDYSLAMVSTILLQYVTSINLYMWPGLALYIYRPNYSPVLTQVKSPSCSCILVNTINQAITTLVPKFIL